MENITKKLIRDHKNINIVMRSNPANANGYFNINYLDDHTVEVTDINNTKIVSIDQAIKLANTFINNCDLLFYVGCDLEY